MLWHGFTKMIVSPSSTRCLGGESEIKQIKQTNMSSFKVDILSFETINELPNSWEKSDYLALLNNIDYDNPEEIKDGELKEMCMMALTDFEPA